MTNKKIAYTNINNNFQSPAFQFYPADWLADENVACMTAQEEGWYIRALSYCWREGSLPADPERLAILIGKGADGSAMTLLSKLFMADPSNPQRLIHKRLNSEREKQQAFRLAKQKAGKKGAKSRWYANSTPNGTAMAHPMAQPMANDAFSSSSLSLSINNTGADVLGNTTRAREARPTPPDKIQKPKPETKPFAPRIALTQAGYASLVEEFGENSFRYYLKVCSDYLVSNGKTKKDYAAFMRNWIRKDVAELKGFYYRKTDNAGGNNSYRKSEPQNLIGLTKPTHIP